MVFIAVTMMELFQLFYSIWALFSQVNYKVNLQAEFPDFVPDIVKSRISKQPRKMSYATKLTQSNYSDLVSKLFSYWDSFQ